MIPSNRYNTVYQFADFSEKLLSEAVKVLQFKLIQSNQLE